MSRELVAALIRFFSGRPVVADLREALARYTLNVPLNSSDAERDLVGELELALAEYEAGHINFDEFASRIAPRINGLLMVASPADDIKAQAQTHLSRQQLWTVEADIRPSLVFWSATSQTA
mgnify:CR=1 FL=1